MLYLLAACQSCHNKNAKAFFNFQFELPDIVQLGHTKRHTRKKTYYGSGPYRLSWVPFHKLLKSYVCPRVCINAGTFRNVRVLFRKLISERTGTYPYVPVFLPWRSSLYIYKAIVTVILVNHKNLYFQRGPTNELTQLCFMSAVFLPASFSPVEFSQRRQQMELPIVPKSKR